MTLKVERDVSQIPMMPVDEMPDELLEIVMPYMRGSEIESPASGDMQSRIVSLLPAHFVRSGFNLLLRFKQGVATSRGLEYVASLIQKEADNFLQNAAHRNITSLFGFAEGLQNLLKTMRANIRSEKLPFYLRVQFSFFLWTEVACSVNLGDLSYARHLFKILDVSEKKDALTHISPHSLLEFCRVLKKRKYFALACSQERISRNGALHKRFLAAMEQLFGAPLPDETMPNLPTDLAVPPSPTASQAALTPLPDENIPNLSLAAPPPFIGPPMQLYPLPSFFIAPPMQYYFPPNMQPFSVYYPAAGCYLP